MDARKNVITYYNVSKWDMKTMLKNIGTEIHFYRYQMTITRTICQSKVKGPDNLYCHSDKLRNDSKSCR